MSQQNTITRNPETDDLSRIRSEEANEPRTIDLGDLFLTPEWPDTVLVIHFPETDTHGIVHLRSDGTEGLAVFTQQTRAEDFQRAHKDRWNAGNPGEIIPKTFEEARQIAIGKGLPVVAVVLCDNVLEPLVHYVR